MPRSVLKWCAVWLAALALSPFTAPFAVVDLKEIVGANVNSRPDSRTNELQFWLIGGESALDLPIVPIAAEVKLTPVPTPVPVVQIGSAPTSLLLVAPARLAGSKPLVAVLRL